MARPTNRGVCAALLVLLGAAGPAAAQSENNALSPAQQEAVEAIVRDVLRENPEIVLEAIQALQERQKAEQQQKSLEAVTRYRDEIENDPTSPVAGNPKGNVTVVEFFDYRCTYCKQVLPSVATLLKNDPNIRYVFKEFPVLSPESETGARAALVMWRHYPEKYFAFHARLMSLRGELGKARILRLAADLGADSDTIAREMDADDLGLVLRRNRVLAEALGIRGTPGFVIGDRVVPGAVGLDALKRMIADARKG